MSNSPKNIIKNWMDYVTTMENLHRRASEFYFNRSLTVRTISLLTVIAVGILNFADIESSYFKFFTGTTNILSAFALMCIKDAKWDEYSYKFKNSCQAYLKIKKLIELHVLMVKINKEEVMEEVIPEIASLLSKVEIDGVQLPEHLKKELKQSYMFHDIYNYDTSIEYINQEPIEVFSTSDEFNDDSTVISEELSATNKINKRKLSTIPDNKFNDISEN